MGFCIIEPTHFRLTDETACQSSGRPLEDYHHKMESKMNLMHFSSAAAISDKLTQESFIFSP